MVDVYYWINLWLVFDCSNHRFGFFHRRRACSKMSECVAQVSMITGLKNQNKAFGIKFLEVEFFISASFAGMLGGICCLGALAGVLVPLWLMNCFRPTSSRCLFFCGISQGSSNWKMYYGPFHRSLVSVAFSYSLFTFQLLSSLHATINQFLAFLTLMVLQSPMETFLKMIAIQNVAVKPISSIQFVIRPSIWPTLHHAMLVAHQLRMEFSKIASAYLAQKI